jgi:hypothetical protein
MRFSVELLSPYIGQKLLSRFGYGGGERIKYDSVELLTTLTHSINWYSFYQL